MGSIWTKTTEFPQRESLARDLHVQAAVIGGGMAGILTAYYLKQSGIHPIVLEAKQIGSGQTKNTTAKITSQHGLIYHRLIKTFGKDLAFQYASANQAAIVEYKKLISALKIDCQFAECPSYLYTTESPESIEMEAKAARSIEIDAACTLNTELPFPVRAALQFSGQARFHPLQFLKEVAEPLEIYEHTLVKSVEDNRILTSHGTVTAEHIIFATHYPFLNVPGYYFMRMHQERSYVLALENAFHPEGMYLGVDQNGFSFRTNGKTLLFGGGSHRTGVHSAGGQFQRLRKAAKQYWPECQEIAAWSAQDCMTLDGIPYIGRFSASKPEWYVATGFQKWGMSSSMVSAMILSQMITGKTPIFSEVFSPDRFKFSTSAKTLMEESVHAARGLAKEFLSPPRTEMDKLPKGHGGVVEYDGQKAGVYKDEQGTLFIVSVKCPHLGCQLEWNPDEKSWDCPCHGSRFDYRGNLLDNPAQEDLLRI